jgi:hypothetical protein
VFESPFFSNPKIHVSIDVFDVWSPAFI